MRHLTPGGTEPPPAARPRLPHARQSSPATAVRGSALAVTPDGTTRNRTSVGANDPTARIAHSSPAADSRIFSRPGDSDSPRAPLRLRSRQRLVVPAAAGGSDTLVPDGTADHLRSTDTAGWPRLATNGEPRYDTPCRNTDSADRRERSCPHILSANSAEGEDDEEQGLALPVLDGDLGCGPREPLTPERSSLAEKLTTSPRGDSISGSSLQNAPGSTIIISISFTPTTLTDFTPQSTSRGLVPMAPTNWPPPKPPPTVQGLPRTAAHPEPTVRCL
jgi:hypothetical protein